MSYGVLTTKNSEEGRERTRGPFLVVVAVLEAWWQCQPRDQKNFMAKEAHVLSHHTPGYPRDAPCLPPGVRHAHPSLSALRSKGSLG